MRVIIVVDVQDLKDLNSVVPDNKEVYPLAVIPIDEAPDDINLSRLADKLVGFSYKRDLDNAVAEELIPSILK